MEIKVLGTGCAGCKILHETVKQAVAELKLAANGRKGRGHHENHVLQCDGPAGVGRG